MCDIAGLSNFDGAAVERQAFSRYRDALAHRGPDGCGDLSEDDAGLALGHRRPAILDLKRRRRGWEYGAAERVWPYLNAANWLKLFRDGRPPKSPVP